MSAEPPCTEYKHRMIWMDRIKARMCQNCDWNMDTDDQWWREGEPRPEPKTRKQPEKGQGALL